MWWFKKIPHHLPKARGPFTPGCVDVSLDYAKSGVLLRLYYPTEEINNDELNHKQWQPCIPDFKYLLGLSRVIMITSYIVRFFYWKSGPMQIPVLYGAKVKTDEKLKCIVYSHGLGAYRSMYSSMSNELASRGYLVAALEHRDESACHTYYYKSQEDAQNDIKTYIKYRAIKLGKDHFDERHRQVQFRADECGKVLDFLVGLNKGVIPHNVMSDVSTENDVEFKLEDLVGKIDVETMTVSGHSFGGASAILALSKRPEFKQGVILDPWMFPIKLDDIATKVTQPLIFINTQTFHIASNVKAMDKYMKQERRREMYTILHTTHENQTDPVFWAGSWLNWFMKKIDPIKGLLINNSLILRFLQENTGHSANIDDCREILKTESINFTSGLTKPWA